MRYGLLKLAEIVPHEQLDAGEKSFIEYVADRKHNAMSSFDGGQMIFSFLIGQKTMLWNSHLGGYPGILQSIKPKPGKVTIRGASAADMADTHKMCSFFPLRAERISTEDRSTVLLLKLPHKSANGSENLHRSSGACMTTRRSNRGELTLVQPRGWSNRRPDRESGAWNRQPRTFCFYSSLHMHLERARLTLAAMLHSPSYGEHQVAMSISDQPAESC